MSVSNGLSVVGRLSLGVALAAAMASWAQTTAAADFRNVQGLQCAAKAARKEARALRCGSRCQQQGRPETCLDRCAQRRDTARARLAHSKRCVLPLPEPIPISVYESAVGMQCRAAEQRGIGDNLVCLALCERKATRSPSGDIETCRSGCDEALGLALEDLYWDKGCTSTLGPPMPAAYIRTDKLWRRPEIPVCWETFDPQDSTKREWVREAIQETWEAASNLRFVGWEPCMYVRPGRIRIRVSDSNPRVTALGSDLGRRLLRDARLIPVGRMYLNFTYQNWGEACQDRVKTCLQANAVHEFGHAIGFTHEQNRLDTPDDCEQEPQGTNGNHTVGPWDELSMMNYCNLDRYNNPGLSQLDIEGVQKFYGQVASTDEPHTDRYGLDYTGFGLSTPSPTDCEIACLDDTRCAAWTYVEPGVQRETAACWLKYGVPAAQPNYDTHSGVIYTVEAQTDRPGGDYKNFDMPREATPGECRAACFAEARCRAWTFVDAGLQGPLPRCWLKDRVNEASRKAWTTSGVIGPGEQPSFPPEFLDETVGCPPDVPDALCYPFSPDDVHLSGLDSGSWL